VTPADFGQAVAQLIGALAELPREVAAIKEEVSAQRAEIAELRRALPPALVTQRVAAECLGVSLSTVQRRTKDGSLPVRRVGRSVRVDRALCTHPERQRWSALPARSGGLVDMTYTWRIRYCDV
jgi:excisionase family DNA binding protein